MTPIETYYDIVGKNYKHLIHVCKEVCKKNREQFSEDILNDTVIQIHNIIKKKGQLDDMSEKGILNYFTRSYVNNLRCEKRYAVISKRDWNVKQESIQDLYESYLNTKTTPKEKIFKDLLEDFSVLFIMKMVELNFDSERYYLFKLKMLCNMTYKEIHDKTHIKKSRDKIIEVKKWVKENLSRDKIKQEFFSLYPELVEYKFDN